MKELNIPAVRENLTQAMDFADEQLRETDCPESVRTQIELVVEEIFMNIAAYAYASCCGYVRIGMEVNDGTAVIRFTDTGTPYNPLSRADPDTETPPKGRKKGGWGIFISKKMTDDMKYEYGDGQNILTVRKSWNAVK